MIVDPRPNPRLHTAAVVTLLLTFPLIFLGGLVTSKQAGMSVPDWPNSYGYNMFLYPPSQWVGGIFYEHTHRLLGTVVGLSTIVMAAVAWGPARTPRRRVWIATLFGTVFVLNVAGTAGMVLYPDRFHLRPEAAGATNIIQQGAITAAGIAIVAIIVWSCRHPEPRVWVRWLATGCLLAVITQGVLGGLRVDLKNLTLAMVHGCFAQATFCLILLTAVVTGRWWATAKNRENRRPVVVLSTVTVLVIYGQLIVGAVMRHSQAGLAIPDLPLAYGRWLPPTTDQELDAINHHRVWDLGMDRVTLDQIWLAYGHRVGAVIVSICILTLAAKVWLDPVHRRTLGLSLPTALMVVLLLTQLSLGLATVHYKKPADVASLHVATGALTLATAFWITARSLRLAWLTPRAVFAGSTLMVPASVPFFTPRRPPVGGR